MQLLNSWQTKIKDLTTSIQHLQTSLSELQRSLPQVSAFIEEINRDFNKWQFKTQPRLKQINKILDQLERKD